MPYVLSPMITPATEGMWGEGVAYEKKTIYEINDRDLPPVNYDAHTLRPHSLTHVETPAHTQSQGARLGHYLEHRSEIFYGAVVVLRLTGRHGYQQVGPNLYHWVISEEEVRQALGRLGKDIVPKKVFITTEEVHLNPDGYHDPSWVLTLSQEAANFLISIPGFHLYGTSWKSSDFSPGPRTRPIHDTLFQKALIFENLRLHDVPEGEYFLSAFPVPLQGASEAPVTPVLYTREEIQSAMVSHS